MYRSMDDGASIPAPGPATPAPMWPKSPAPATEARATSAHAESPSRASAKAATWSKHAYSAVSLAERTTPRGRRPPWGRRQLKAETARRAGSRVETRTYISLKPPTRVEEGRPSTRVEAGPSKLLICQSLDARRGRTLELEAVPRRASRQAPARAWSRPSKSRAVTRRLWTPGMHVRSVRDT